MNKHIDQTELGKQVAQDTGLSQSTADAFIDQFFSEIENNLINGVSTNINGLGIFRIIKSGNSNKILFLASKKNIDQNFTKENFTNLLLSKSTDNRSITTISNSEVQNTSYKRNADELDNKLTSNEDDNIILTNKKKSLKSINDNSFNSDKKGNKIPSAVDNFLREKDSKTSINIQFKEDTLEIKEENYKKHELADNDLIKNEQIKREEKKKNAIILPIFISLLILVIIIGVSYLFFESARKSSIDPTEQEYSVNFHELSVNDSININSIVIPDKDVSLEYIARTFYGNEIFWPYIYVANEDFMNNSTIALAGSIIKIPRLTVDLVAYNDGSVTTAAQKFGDEIRKSKKIY